MKKSITILTLLVLLLSSNIYPQIITPPFNYAFPGTWFHNTIPAEGWLGAGSRPLPEGTGSITINSNTAGGAWSSSWIAGMINPSFLNSAQGTLASNTDIWLITPSVQIDVLSANKLLTIDLALTDEMFSNNANTSLFLPGTALYVLMSVDNTWSRQMIIAEWNLGGTNGAFDLNSVTSQWQQYDIIIPERDWSSDWDGTVKFAFYVHCQGITGGSYNYFFMNNIFIGDGEPLATGNVEAVVLGDTGTDVLFLPDVLITVIIPGGHNVTGYTNNDGNVIIQNVPVGDWDVQASKPGWQTIIENYDTGTLTEGSTAFVGFVLEPAIELPTGNIEGMVLGEDNSNVIMLEDVLITVIIPIADNMTAVTNSDGYFFIENVPVGDWDVQASKPGWQTMIENYDEGSLTEGATAFVGFVLQPEIVIKTGNVEGIVMGETEDEVIFLDDVLITIIIPGDTNITGFTNSEGYFFIENVPVGDWDVKAEKTGWITAIENYDTGTLTEGGTAFVGFVLHEEIPSIFPWTESFDSPAFPPPGWIRSEMLQDIGQPSLVAVQWDSWIGGAHSGERHAVSFSVYAFWALLPDNWLITPAIELNQDKGYGLSYYVKILSRTEPDETYAVYISTTPITNPLEPDLTTFQQVHKETMQQENSVWTERYLDLSEYAGQTIHIAFRHFESWVTPGSSHWSIGIDDVSVIELNDYELTALSINGPRFPGANSTASYSINVMNIGSMPMPNNYSVKLMSTNGELASINGVNLQPRQTHTFVLDWNVPMSGTFDIFGRIVPNTGAFANPDTEIIQVMVQPEGTSYVDVGTREEFFHSQIAFVVNTDSGISQTIFYEHELQNTGVIHKIQMKALVTEGGLKNTDKVTLWMKHSNKQNFAGEIWEPYDGFQQVYHGPIDTQTDGFYDVPIDLQYPFEYTGGNLVLMYMKHYIDPDHHIGMDIVRWEDSNIGMDGLAPERSIFRPKYSPGDLVLPDFLVDGVGLTWDNYPNTRFYFLEPAGLATLSGIVTDGINPLENVQVKLEGFERLAVTNQQGEFVFDFLEPDGYAFTATLHGYSDYESPLIVLAPGAHITHDFELNIRPRVTVSGTVIASDTSQPLSGVLVSITGYEDKSFTTGQNGSFSIDIYNKNVYTMTISLQNYQTIMNNNLIVTDVPLNLGNIILQERVNRPRNVIASLNGINADVSWEAPRDIDTWFSHSHFTYGQTLIGGHSYGHAVLPLDFIAAHRYTPQQLASFGTAGATLTKIAFYTSVDYDPNRTFTLKIWKGGSGNPLQPGTMIYSQELDMIGYSSRMWVAFELDIPITIPTYEEFWIGLHYKGPAGYPASLDDGPRRFGYGDIFWWGSVDEWRLFETIYVQGNLILDLFVEGAMPASDVMYNSDIPVGNAFIRSSSPLDPVGNAFIRSSSPLDPVGNECIRSYSHNSFISESHQNRAGNPSYNDADLRVIPFSPVPERNTVEYAAYDTRIKTANRNLDRTLNQYEIYRFNINNPNDLVLLGNTPATQFTFNDSQWNQAVDGGYRYAVKAVYSNDNVSLPAVSNALPKNFAATLFLDLKTEDDNSVMGSLVKLVNNNGDPVLVYDFNIMNYPIMLNDIWFGEYTITISLDGYFDVVFDNFIVNNVNQNAEFILLKKHTLIDEGFPYDPQNHIWPPQNWTIIDGDSDGNNWTQFWMEWEDYYNGTMRKYGAASLSTDYNNPMYPPLYPDNWLISPPISFEDGIAVLEYTVFAYDELAANDFYSVYVSTTTPEIQNFTELIYSERLNSLAWFWWDRSFDISRFAGKTIYIAFRHHDSINQGILVITDVKVHANNVEITNINDDNVVPIVTNLKQNFPNPFNPITNIAFDKQSEGWVTIDVFNIRGQKVKTLTNQIYAKGNHNVIWNGTDEVGRNVSSGVYFYRLTTDEITATRKMLLLK